LLALSSLLTAAALLAALAALAWARRLARRLEQLTESYWELRYELGQLRARLAELERPGTAPPDPSVSTAFVPFSSLKR
jgi:hypothetical protein